MSSYKRLKDTYAPPVYNTEWIDSMTPNDPEGINAACQNSLINFLKYPRNKTNKKWFDKDCETLCKDFPWCTDDRLDPKVVQERIKLYKEKGIGPFFAKNSYFS